MPRIRTYVTICSGVLALVFLALVLLVSFADLGLSGHGITALFLGALLTVVLAMALMGLVFMSDSSGYDANTHLAASGNTSAGAARHRGDVGEPTAGDTGGKG